MRRKAVSPHKYGLCFAFLIAGMAATGMASGAELSSDGANRIRFAATQLDVAVEGEFKTFTAEIDFDPSKPETSNVDVSIDLASVATGSADADTVLKGRDLFDVAHFPRAVFTSTKITMVSQGHYQALGRLTVKGHSADLTVPFAARSGPDGLTVEGGVPISRLAYRVGEGEWSDAGTLADLVQLQFRLRLLH